MKVKVAYIAILLGAVLVSGRMHRKRQHGMINIVKTIDFFISSSLSLAIMYSNHYYY